MLPGTIRPFLDTAPLGRHDTRVVFFSRLDFTSERSPPMPEVTFRDYFKAAHTHAGLTDREKAFIGLAVTLSRGCEP